MTEKPVRNTANAFAKSLRSALAREPIWHIVPSITSDLYDHAYGITAKRGATIKNT